jgi:hypothetical protein
MAGTALCRGQLNRKNMLARRCLTVAVFMGKSRSLLIIGQDRCHHELSPLIDGLFTQRRNASVET